jgi:HK97 family phage prohead protease
METKVLENFMQLKSVTDKGEFEGIASTIGNVDLTGDEIGPFAFQKTLRENPTVPILLQHRPDSVLGTGDVKQVGNEIRIAGKLDMDDPLARKAISKMKKKLISSLSIGFLTLQSRFKEVAGKSIRVIESLDLKEVSIVTFGANPLAGVLSVKSRPANGRLRNKEGWLVRPWLTASEEKYLIDTGRIDLEWEASRGHYIG